MDSTQVESAAFATAYVLGLPCFPFAPSAAEAAALVGDDAAEPRVHALLVWLAAGVAAERRTKRKLVAADPRQPAAFLALLRSRGLAADGETRPDDDRVRYALKEADALQRDMRRDLADLADFFESGAATAGDVVKRLEGIE